ncbi:artemis isoform X2, partial [Paramuricea clavata]
ESTKKAVVELIKRWLSKGCNYYVSLLCKGMYGYEYLLKEVAMALNTKIHVSSERLSLYKNLPDMTKHFTTKAENTRIHSCNWEHERNINSKLPCGFSLPAPEKVNVIKIKATSMWFARRTEPLPSDCVFQVSKDFYRVIHSMHASMEEVHIFILNIYT